MEQRPAAMVALDAAKIDTDLALQLELIRLTEILTQEDVLRGDGRIRLQLEDPVPVLALLAQQRLCGAAYVVFDAVDGARSWSCAGLARAKSECGRSLA